MKARTGMLVAAGAISVAAVVTAYRCSSSGPRVPPSPPDDDLDLLGTWLDGAPSTPAGPPRALLVAGGGALYLATASDRTVLAIRKPVGASGEPRVLAHLDVAAWGMAHADASLWITMVRAGRDAVVRVDEESGAVANVAVSGVGRPRAIACDGKWIFLVDVEAEAQGLSRKSAVARVPVEGGAAAILATSDGEITSLALDDANVYWADGLRGAILSAPKTGGEPRVLASDRGLPRDVVVSGDSIAWVEQRGEAAWTMPKAGGEARMLVQDFAGFAHLVADARGVAWSNESAVDGRFRVLTAPWSGGDATPASEPTDAVDAVATDGTTIFWAHGANVSAIANE